MTDDPILRIAAEMERELAEIDADERFHYPTAIVQVNAPLALVQLEMETRERVLKKYAARLRALWTPERAEFVLAAKRHGEYRAHLHLGTHIGSACNCCCHTEENMVDAYRAMLAAKEGKADG